MLVLFERLRQVTGKDRIAEVWPGLRLVIRRRSRALPLAGAEVARMPAGTKQTLYYLFVAFQKYGGEDGTQLLERLSFGAFPLNNRIVLYYVVFAALVGTIVLIDRIVESRFGMVLQGCRQNERSAGPIHALHVLSGARALTMPHYNTGLTIDRDRWHDTKRGVEPLWHSWCKSPIWKSIRRHRLAEEPHCRECAIEGRTVPANHVDHIEPAARAIILATCDYLTQTHTSSAACRRQSAFEPLVEAAVTAVIRRVLMEGMPKDAIITGFPPVMIATAASWAIYGAVKEWFNTPDRPAAEEIVPVILRLVLPILQTATPVESPFTSPLAQNI